MATDLLKAILLQLSKDQRITVWHMATMLGILLLSGQDEIDRPIYICRRKIMALAHISSIATYHKCMKELQHFGYLIYMPSFHPGIRSRVDLKLGANKSNEI